MEIRNGATVHRIWGSLPSADLLAVFQSPTDAEEFCKSMLARGREPEKTFLVSVNHYDGQMKCFHPAAPVEGAAA